MNQKYNYLLVILLSGIFLFLTSCSESNPVDPNEYGDGDDYSIYSKVIKEKIGDPELLIVVSDSTVKETFLENSIDHFMERFPEASRETLENLVEANKNKCKIKRINGINFIYSSEFDNSTDNKVSVSLSRVGYNSEKTEAFVSIGILYHPWSGHGSLFNLKKVNGSWQIVKRIKTWMT